MKTCFKCGVEKPLSEFYEHKLMADGHLNKCKECTKRDVKMHRENNPEKVRACDRKRSKAKHRKEYAAKRQVKYRESFPEKYKANNAVTNAIRDGRIDRPNHCEMCGHPCTPHAHHWSYLEEHMLEVEWLCVVCHMQLHHKK